jgi:hypothetical protein
MLFNSTEVVKITIDYLDRCCAQLSYVLKERDCRHALLHTPDRQHRLANGRASGYRFAVAADLTVVFDLLTATVGSR